MRRYRPLATALLGLATLVVVLASTDMGAVGRALGQTRPWHIAAGLALMLLRDPVADVSLWRAALAWFGHRVRYGQLLRVYLEFVPLKFLLPFKLGDAARVAALRAACGVPVVAGGGSRLATMGVQAGALLILGSVFASLASGAWWPVAAGGAGIALLAWLTAREFRWRERTAAADEERRTDRPTRLLARWPHAAIALMSGLGSAAASLALYSLFVGQALGEPPDAATLAVVAATVLACHLPISIRGVGVRELLLTTAVARTAGAESPALLGAGLAISALELLFVLLLGGGFAGARVAGLIRPRD
ncbi:MAG: lysylphosphatidylglycerol synthase domain-containing protein [Myxococcota bacterium]|nr:lysylphosphatidylglycerol synthase domain-containing protein [Myxococcota bacterium]